MTAEPPDLVLAARFRESGDRQAFEALVLRHLGTLRRFLAVALPGDPEGARDVEQEVLVKVHRSLPSWRGDGAFTTFLFILARRAAADEVRRRVRERRKVDRFARWSRPQDEGSEVDADPQVAWVAVEEGRALRRALEALPEPDRTLLYLKDAEGFEVEALARIHGLKEGTVKSKLSRARARMRDLLKEELYA